MANRTVLVHLNVQTASKLDPDAIAEAILGAFIVGSETEEGDPLGCSIVSVALADEVGGWVEAEAPTTAALAIGRPLVESLVDPGRDVEGYRHGDDHPGYRL